MTSTKSPPPPSVHRESLQFAKKPVHQHSLSERRGKRRRRRRNRKVMKRDVIEE